MIRKCEGCDNEVTSVVKTVRFCSVACARKNAPRGKPGPKAKERESKVCPSCEAEFQTRWDRQVCCSKSCARALNAKVNGPANWKGGVNKLAAGYLKELRKDHPAADRYGYVMQHRLVMEEKLGRALEAHERVHHRDGVRDNNDPENLELWIVGKKDPPGQRAVDLARSMVAALSEAERAELFNEFRST